MSVVRIAGTVDENHRLSAQAPTSMPPGPVTVLLIPEAYEDDAGDAWESAIALEWADDLNDVRQDIYTLADGEPIGET